MSSSWYNASRMKKVGLIDDTDVKYNAQVTIKKKTDMTTNTRNVNSRSYHFGWIFDTIEFGSVHMPYAAWRAASCVTIP